jgi:hypothetical protein
MKTDRSGLALAAILLMALALPFIIYAQEGEPPAQEVEPPALEEPAPALEEAVPTQEEAVPTQEEAVQAPEEAVQAEDEPSRSQEGEVPAEDGVTAAEAREAPPPVREEPAYSFSGVVPEALIRPTRERGAFYPVDAVIGPLGVEDLAGEAGDYAKTVMQDLLSQDAASASIGNLGTDITGDAMEKLSEAAPHKWRLGGGREEADGSVSFLFRFMGREKEVSGELYLRSADGGWKTEDIIFNTPKELTIGAETSSSSYTPYERFY